MNDIIQRPLDTGKWKVGIKPGREVVSVSLVGMRNRPYPLSKITKEEFQSRCMRGPTGAFEDNIVTRGTPHWYYFDGAVIHLNPSPAHQWTLQVELRDKR